VDVQVCALGADDNYRRGLASLGVSLYSDSTRLDSVLNQIRTIRSSAALSKKLAVVARRAETSDWYVILADEALGVVNYLRNSKVGYLSCGDLDLVFLNPAFYETQGLTKRWLARGLVTRIGKHREWARKCDILLALSAFAKQLMTLVYGVPFIGVVYPPVDTEFFRRMPQNDDAAYAAAVVRNVREQNLGVLKALASRVHLKVLGGGTIPGAETLGVVSDKKFVEVLSGARVLAFSSPAELFGYPVLESMSCGTPSVAFANGGPAELVDHGKNGWLVSTNREFVDTAEKATIDGYAPSFREEARTKALKFSIPEMTAKLISYLT
jgi:glycosyltransferase involved in cell wall biosynthesis